MSQPSAALRRPVGEVLVPLRGRLLVKDTPYVFNTAQHDAELSRLRAIESIFDAASRRFLLATGVRAGWKCLEVGAGAGSIATWLANVVGGSGRVTAVHVNP